MSVHATSISLAPVWKDEAYAFVRANHRHERDLPSTWICGVGVEDVNGNLVGVAILGKPGGRYSVRHAKLIGEATRCCTVGSRNACSMLYGAICRAAAALGKHLVVTYTREDEDGASLKASGFVAVAKVRARQRDCPTRRRRVRAPEQVVARIRWERRLCDDRCECGT